MGGDGAVFLISVGELPWGVGHTLTPFDRLWPFIGKPQSWQYGGLRDDIYEVLKLCDPGSGLFDKGRC